ncbi:aspartyl protease family protein [Altererythrobacter sp. JGD-16]|uniref:Aspartyl protease family protein n=2 Tax=Altererythrobacter lutimaris TaxID=2743979 RepID=A0A850HBH5_9SPHN|nr:aspartyl protease family protein [Altererythrobacter lutimaris]
MLASTLALVSSSVAQTPVADQAIAPNLSDPETELLQLEEERNKRLTLPVNIEGVGPFDFMIDTGSQATVVTHEINERLALPDAGTAIVVGMASRREVNLVELDGLQFGSRTIDGLTAPVLERAHIGADGIIGLDSLQDMRVLFDFRKKTIAVADATEKLSSRGFEIIVRARPREGQLLITQATVEGVKATVIIDTGAQATLGNLALRERIRKRREQQQVVTTDVNGVSITTPLTFARSLRIQGLELKNLPITYADAPAFEALGLKDEPVLSLGMQHLKAFDRVAIDFNKRRVLFDLPNNARSSRGSI